jgi:hypothetical protein
MDSVEDDLRSVWIASQFWWEEGANGVQDDLEGWIREL